MAPSRYVIDYQGSFAFSAPPAVVWAAMEDLNQFEGWWGWLGNFRFEGGGLHRGAVLHGTVAPPVPYRMAVTVEVERCVPGSMIDATVHGDLEGIAHLTLEPVGETTRVDVDWNIEMMQRPMRVAATVAYPALRWGHDRVVAATVKGFHAHLSKRQGRPPR